MLDENPSEQNTAPPIDQQHLVARIQSGDREAESELVARYWRGLYFVLAKRLRDSELASDLTQDAFIVVLKKAREGKITNPDAISAFIRQVGVNLLIAHHRTEQRRSTDASTDIVQQAADSTPSLYQQLDQAQTSALVRTLVSELKVERDREILKRLYFLGEEKSSICADLDLTTEHFDRVISRARRRLKQLIVGKLGSSASEKLGADMLSVALLLVMAAQHGPTNDMGGFYGSHHYYWVALPLARQAADPNSGHSL